MTYPTTWSDAQVTALRQLWGHLRAARIGELIGKSGNAVIGKANRMGLEPVPREKVQAWIESSCLRRLEAEQFRYMESNDNGRQTPANSR